VKLLIPINPTVFLFELLL